MEWYLALSLFLGSLLLLFIAGMPIAFAFLSINIMGMVVFFGGGLTALEHLSRSIAGSVSSFVLLPIPLFVLMGEVAFHSGIGSNVIDAIDKWLGRLPGRLALIAVGAGTLFGTLTGDPVASVAVMGEALLPEMEKRGYERVMSMGPIMGSSGLALLIPPSVGAVFVASIGQFSVAKTLMAIIMPGLLMAFMFATYIIIRSVRQPSVAPPYAAGGIPLSQKLLATVKYIMPLGFIVFAVTGVIFLGIATPSEAAATGALSTIILAAAYRRLSWKAIKRSFSSSAQITVMILMILTGSITFSQILAYTGASATLIELALAAPVAPIGLILIMQIPLLIMGAFMDPFAITMVALPLYMPVVLTLGFDPVWFGVIFLIMMTSGNLTPPFGLTLFLMKGIAPPDTTIAQIVRAAFPYFVIYLAVILSVIFLPQLALWMPSVLR